VSDDNWNQVKQIFNSVLELDPSGREEYLAEACAGDNAIRRQVEGLLESYLSDFLENPIAPNRQTNGARLVTGKLFGHYEIVRLIGSGGMGEVYLAKDSKLDRNVALKVLNEKYESNESNIQRFIQEAKAASALNHPSILTIYEIGDTEQSHYIVSEYIDGKTLREILERRKLELSKILDISIQIAGALAAAHSARIIHRDIKPENVIVRDDGLVKVLDFGLAKLIRKQPSLIGLEEETIKQNRTAEGLILGTVSYMSPEQARGEKIDIRTDIFSLGIVIYEMIAGRTPFAGGSMSETFANLLKTEPPPLEMSDSQLSLELGQVVNKALAKDRDDRYATAHHFAAALKKIKTRFVRSDADETSSNQPNPEEKTTFVFGQRTVGAAHVTAPSIGQQLRHRISYVAITLLTFIMAIWGLSYLIASAPPESIAVMPFVNETGIPETEYLSDGLTESLIGRLSQIPNLSVKARSSVFRYKGKDMPIKNIGKDLNVPVILTGHVTRRENEFVLYVELVDTATENIMWRAEYNRPNSSLATIPSEIARDVANNIRHKLSGAEEQSVTRTYTENSTAYELYLKGRYYWDKRNEDAYKVAIDAYTQAIKLDPNYALAYAGLADLYLFRDGDIGRSVAMPLAKQYALKALENDETLAEAHNTLAFVNENYDFDMTAAEAGFKRAMELKPNYAVAHQFYGGFLVQTGRTEEGLAELRKAIDLEPYSAAINWHYGHMLLLARRYDEAIEQQQKTLQIQPNYQLAKSSLASAYMYAGRFNDAAALIQKQTEQDSENQGGSLTLARVKILSGDPKEGEKILARVLQEREGRKINLYAVAGVYATLGDKDKAIEWLNRGYDQRVFQMFFLRVDPAFDGLHDDPRFQELLRRIGLVS